MHKSDIRTAQNRQPSINILNNTTEEVNSCQTGLDTKSWTNVWKETLGKISTFYV